MMTWGPDVRTGTPPDPEATVAWAADDKADAFSGPDVGGSGRTWVRYRRRAEETPRPDQSKRRSMAALGTSARCRVCGATQPRTVVHQYQGWTFGQAIALALASFAIALAVLAVLMFGLLMFGSPGPSTVPQPIPPRTATP